EHAGLEALQIGHRLRVALPGLGGVAPYDLLETGVLGHVGKPPLQHPRPPATRCCEMACDIDDREGQSPSPMEPRLGRALHSSATGRRRAATLPDAPRPRQAPHHSTMSRPGMWRQDMVALA